MYEMYLKSLPIGQGEAGAVSLIYPVLGTCVLMNAFLETPGQRMLPGN